MIPLLNQIPTGSDKQNGLPFQLTNNPILIRCDPVTEDIFEFQLLYNFFNREISARASCNSASEFVS